MKQGDIPQRFSDRRPERQWRDRFNPRGVTAGDKPQVARQDALTRAIIQIGSVLRLETEDQRLMAVVGAQRAVDELREAFQEAMMVVQAAQRLRESYHASVVARDHASACRTLEEVECAEVALLVALGRMAKAAPMQPQPQTWIDGAL